MLGNYFGRFTSLSSVRQADSFVVHPNDFKHLRKDEMVMIDKTNGRRVVIVQVRAEIRYWQLGAEGWVPASSQPTKLRRFRE